VTQNWSFLKCQNRWPILTSFFSLCIQHFFGGRRSEIGARFCETENKAETYFWAEICSNHFRDAFTINIDLVSDANLERKKYRAIKQGFRSQH